MHYIRCNHCGGLIEVRSEYMIFCPTCEAKLNNSFAAWRAKSVNAEKSFRDYLGEVTVSRSALTGIKEQRRITKQIGRGRAIRRLGWAVLIAFAVAVVSGGIWWLAGKYGRSDGSIKTLLDKEIWKISYYPDLGATLKFPHVLEKAGSFAADSLQADSTLTAQQQVVTSAVNRVWATDGVISVTASRIDYRPDFGVDRDVATGQVLQSMLAGNGNDTAGTDHGAVAGDRIQAFEFFKNDYSVPNIEARSMAGRYLLGPQAFEFRALMAQYEHTVWYFMAAYPADTPEGILVAERFFRGILLDRRLQ